MNTLATFVGSLVQKAMAQSPIEEYCNELHPGCGSGTAFVGEVANRVIDIASEFIGGVALIFLLQGALWVIASGGSDERRNKGKNLIITALVGIFLAIMGKTFVFFVNEVVSSNV